MQINTLGIPRTQPAGRLRNLSAGSAQHLTGQCSIAISHPSLGGFWLGQTNQKTRPATAPHAWRSIKIVLSTSTLLHLEQQKTCTRGTQHRDYVTIPGAKIVHLHEAFMSEYGKVTIGMDIVLVAGLNEGSHTQLHHAVHNWLEEGCD